MNDETRLRRWRLILGSDAGPSSGEGLAVTLSESESQMDRILQALYDSDRKAGLGNSSPHVNRWLGDIRTYFPASVVRVMQQDALQRLKLTQLLFEKETLDTIVPDIHLVSTLLTLKNVIPNKTKATARLVVLKVVDELQRKLQQPLMQAVHGSLHRASRTNRPRDNEIDWHRTIRKNLQHYQPDYRTVIAEKLTGFRRRASALQDVILCVDQSGSMASSVVYSSVCAAVLASLKTLAIRLVFFDTAVLDMTESLHDPVDILFGAQLGGGTDIHRAVAYCQQHITRPAKTTMVLITDLVEGGDRQQLVQRIRETVQSGVLVICLLALSDSGAACHDETLASAFASQGVPCFACTPDVFPELMSQALQRRDISQWAAREKLVLKQ
ncbi:MAG: VWA domain-containing protein [Planctomycetia bacterium]|nr:VWA domain-containing protein [Planctomycetia bacterium]